MSKNRNKILTQFDLSSAFTALSDMDYAAPEGTVKSFQENLVERKGYGKCFEPLFEDLYDLEDTQDLNDAADAREAEVAQAKLSRIEKIIDLDAKSPDELLPSYVGKIIVQCPQCMNLFYKDEADIEKDEEDPTLCNVGEECQHCGNTSGYTLIGKVDAATEEDLNQGMEAPAEETPAVEEQPAEETPEENPEETTKETGDEDLNLDDMDLDLNLDEEPAQESFNTNPDGQVLTENVEKLDEECMNKTITDFLLDDSNTHKSLNVILSDLYKAHPEAPAENVQSAMDGVLNVEWPLNKIETFGFCAKQHPYVEGLTEEVDKDLDKKLAEHDTYIDYLRKEIETLENSIKNEKNEEIKAAKQAHLDELNQSLDAALPDAVKNGSVEVNTENTEDTSDDNLDADDVLNGKLNNEETTEENADQTEEQPISAPEEDDEEQVKESLTESVTIDVDDLDFCQMVNDGKINDVNKYNLGYTRLCELSQICVDNHLDRAYDIIEKAIDQITGYNEENSLTEDKRDDDDYYGRDIDDAVIQLKKRGHAEFWCRQGKEKAEEVKKIAKDKYNLDVKYTIDNDYCEAKVIKENFDDEHSPSLLNVDSVYSPKEKIAVANKLKSIYNDPNTKQEVIDEIDSFLQDFIDFPKMNGIDDIDNETLAKVYYQVKRNGLFDESVNKLDEAVAITISVDEVDDTVTPKADTMVIDNGDAGVAKYHADDSDVNNEDPFNQDFEPVEFNRPAFNPFANTEFDFDNETDETAIQNVEPEEMDDKKLDKSDEKELEKELDSEDDSDDKDDKDDEDKGKKAKDESLTESVKNKLTEETLNEGPLNFIKKGIAKAFTSIMDPKFASTLDNFYKDQLATGGKYIVYCDKFMSGTQEGQNKQYKITTTFKDILNIIRQQSKAQPDATFTILSPQTDVNKFVAAITKAQDEGNKNRKSQTFKLAYQDLMKIINSDTISEFVGGKQTDKGRNALKALYGSIKAGNGSFEDTSAQNAETEDSNTEVNNNSNNNNTNAVNNNQQNQNTNTQGTVDQINTQNNNVQPAAEPQAKSAETAENTNTNAGSTEAQEAPKINPQELIKGLRAKYGDKYDGWKTMGNTLKTLDDAGLLSGEYNKEQWDDYDEYKNHRTEAFNTNSNGTILTEAMSDEDYNRLFDSTTYGNKLSDFYDLSSRCGEIFESTYQSLGYPMDDEWIIAPEILKDDNKVTELYNAVRKNVVDILNNGSRDELDDGHHGDVIGTLIDLFDINQVFENLDEAKDDKKIVDDVTDAEFQELINSDIFNEKCEDKPTETKKITEDSELDHMLDQLDTEIDNVLNQEEQSQKNSNNSNKEEFDQEMLDEIDEDGLEECLSKSLVNIYENVENFKISDINLVNNRLIVEGKIKFNKSGNTLDTKYIFNDIYKDNDKLILNGYNKTLSEDCNLVLTGNIKNKKFITESFEYNYTVEGDKVHGKVNNN